MDKPLLFESYVKSNKPEFIQKVKDVSKDLGIQPNWLMAVMKNESGINAQAQNTKFPFSNGYATGLIQFTPDTAIHLGTTVDDLYSMSNVDQLDFVKKYFEPYKSKIKSFPDLYMVTFFPVALGKPDNWVLQTNTLSKEIIAKDNPSFDIHKRGYLTVGDVKQAFINTVPKQYQKYITTTNVSILTGIILLGGGLLAYRYFSTSHS